MQSRGTSHGADHAISFCTIFPAASLSLSDCSVLLNFFSHEFCSSFLLRQDWTKLLAMKHILIFMQNAFLFAWLSCSVAASPLLSQQITTLPQTSSPLRRQAGGDNGTFAITGIADFGTQQRLELRELQKDRDTWNIYMLGLQRFHATPQDGKLSFYKIAGDISPKSTASELHSQTDRYTWSSLRAMGWRSALPGKRLSRLLRTHLESVPAMAPPISRTVRTNALHAHHRCRQ
jgi:tyrosinase